MKTKTSKSAKAKGKASKAKAPRKQVSVTAYGRQMVEGYTIDKDRAQANGTTRPSSGTVSGVMWKMFDRRGPELELAQVRRLAELQAWNPNNAVIEFYQWRKFNGITRNAIRNK